MSHVEDNMEAVLAALPGLCEPAAVRAPEAENHADLMRRCQGGDEDAFAELVRRYQPRVGSVVRGILRHSNDCDDVTQQVFTKVYFALKRFNFQSAVSTWIYKITVNECYDHLRKQKVRHAKILADLSEQEAAWIENHDPGDGAPSLARQVETRELADKLLARVAVDDRVLLVLKEVEGYAVREVAAIMGLNENTVKVRLFRARQALVSAWRKKRV
ncbi:MAG: RNA polymerase sigma factor [Terriglobales bacterium]